MNSRIPFLLAFLTASATCSVQPARISLVDRAYVHMPIWLRVDLPGIHQRTVRYPITVYPADFGGHDFEVHYRGQPLPKIKMAAAMPKVSIGPVSFGAVGGGSLLGLEHEPRQVGVLPLHLAFRFDYPGEYLVRYTGYDIRGDALFRSTWTTFRVEPYAEQARLAWLDDMRTKEPSDAVELISEHLPSVLAYPDAKSLGMLESAVYSRDEVVRRYAMHALYLFSDQDLIRWIPDVLKRRGPTVDLAYFISWRESLLDPYFDVILASVAEHLRSKSPNVVSGTLQTLAFLKQYKRIKADSTKAAEMDRLVVGHADSFIRIASQDVLQPLAVYLGGVKTDAARSLLWRLVEQGAVRQQALFSLIWIADKRDRARLATFAKQYQLAPQLQRAYGTSNDR